jgi:hypothetical protein
MPLCSPMELELGDQVSDRQFGPGHVVGCSVDGSVQVHHRRLITVYGRQEQDERLTLLTRLVDARAWRSG